MHIQGFVYLTIFKRTNDTWHMGIYVEWKFSDTENVKICVWSGERGPSSCIYYHINISIFLLTSIYFSLMCNRITDVTFLCCGRKKGWTSLCAAAYQKIYDDYHDKATHSDTQTKTQWDLNKPKQNEISTNPLKHSRRRITPQFSALTL